MELDVFNTSITGFLVVLVCDRLDIQHYCTEKRSNSGSLGPQTRT